MFSLLTVAAAVARGPLAPASTCFSLALFVCTLDGVYSHLLPTEGLCVCRLLCVVGSHCPDLSLQQGVLTRGNILPKSDCHLPLSVSISDRTELIHANI